MAVTNTLQKISIHAPREGSDLKYHYGDDIRSISIHAPREGSDCGHGKFCVRQNHFNPRSP